MSDLVCDSKEFICHFVEIGCFSGVDISKQFRHNFLFDIGHLNFILEQTNKAIYKLDFADNS